MSIEELTQAFMQQLQGKDEMISALLEKIDSLEKSNRDQADMLRQQAESITRMGEELSRLQRMLFGTKSEKMHDDKKDDDRHQDSDGKESDGTSASGEKHTDKKRIYRRPERRDYDGIEAEDVIELRPDDKLIDGAKLLKVAHSYRFYYIPGKLCKVRIDRYIYHKDGHLITPKLPYAPETFERRHVSPELSAWLLTAKFYYHLPYERVLTMLNESGPIKIAKATLFDWATAGIDALDGLYEAIRAKVLSDWHLNIDETVQKLLNTRKHICENVYDWGFVSKTFRLMYFKTYSGVGDDSPRDGTRSQVALDEEIKDYKGDFMQCDAYGAYEHAAERAGKDIGTIYCMAHIRRKFFDSLEYHRKYASEALEIINAIYDDERKYRKRGLTARQIASERKTRLKKKLDRFRIWLAERMEASDFIENTYIAKAIRYAWTKIDSFYILISHGELDIDNNIAERCMRGHTLGRKNYNFCRNIDAVDRTCRIYSIIESCKLSGIDPYRYLCMVLTREPSKGETWDDLLPCNIKM